MIMSARTLCPYCLTIQRVPIEPKLKQYIVVLCSIEDGGCDKQYVADVSVEIVSESIKLQRDGE